jgi:histidinol dehydrogenase
MNEIAFAVRGDARALAPSARAVLFDRSRDVDSVVRDRTTEIIARVRSGGDTALRALAAEFDGLRLEALEVPGEACERALRALEPAVRRALERAAANIRAVHEAFLPRAQEFTTTDGVVLGRRPDPLARVGVYAPGGRASYPSSLLMGVVPARVAGVREVVACSPPTANGMPSDIVMAAAAIAGVDRLFAVGGAGAIAAMAFGTASVPRVDRIVGPGNAYVAAAKLQVAGVVGIDSPAGPSELLVIADDGTDPGLVAGEMLAQAEHDPDAAVVLVSTSARLSGAVDSALLARIDAEPRAPIIRAAFATRGASLLAPSLDAAISLANEWAGEHVLLALDPAGCAQALAQLRNAGSVFVGQRSSVAFGDYMTGANHVLPTGGHARTHSGLSSADFMRWTSWQRVTREAAMSLAGDVAALALAEGLPAHARAAIRGGEA